MTAITTQKVSSRQLFMGLFLLVPNAVMILGLMFLSWIIGISWIGYIIGPVGEIISVMGVLFIVRNRLRLGYSLLIGLCIALVFAMVLMLLLNG